MKATNHIIPLLTVSLAGLLLEAAVVQAAPAVTHFVDLNSASPTPPYLTWATAATNIQDAIDVAADGDTVLVTNGIYQTGGRVVNGVLSNRVAVTKPLLVRSVSGPEFTVIKGIEPWSDEAIRCVFLANGASLCGFTLTNGATRRRDRDYLESSGGGVWCESATAVVSNCVVAGNRAYWSGGGAWGGTLITCSLENNSVFVSGGGGAAAGILNNCTLKENSAGSGSGGGAAFCILNRCTLTGNTGERGGGSAGCTLNNCTLNDNGADFGGGASDSTLNNCTLLNNLGAQVGGGAYFSTLNNCTLSGNRSPHLGGGAWGGTLNNCTLTGNSAGVYGGGAYDSTLNNCTLTGNSAQGNPSPWSGRGGGAYRGTLNNCIAYYNTAEKSGPNYDDSSILNYCCTTPMPTNGVGNITSDPLFEDSSLHLQPNSPCINAGSNAYVTNSTDLDGNPRIVGGTVDMGAFEYQGDTATVLVARLMAQVESSWLRSQPLLASLSAALRSVERGNFVAAENQLQAFQHKVRAQVARSDPSLAASFIEAAKAVIDVLRSD